MKVWLLDTGTMRMDRAQVLWNAPGGRPVDIQSYAVLIEHEGGLLLADTGFDLAHAERELPFLEPRQRDDQTLDHQLGLCGFRLGDVDTIVNSHLHFDHAGGNRLLPRARVLVHEAELAHAREPLPFERLAYSDTSWDANPTRIVGFTGDRVIAPGLRLYETPGHSAGHCSLMIEAPGERPVVLSFDVAYTREAFERSIQPTMHVDPVAGLASIRRVQQLASDARADVLVLHDPKVWEALPHAPDTLLPSAARLRLG